MSKISPGIDGDHLNELLSIIEIGTWDWYIDTGYVIYSSAWAKILGYTAEELPSNVTTWERMVFEEDLVSANNQIALHLSGEKALYEAEFRMTCKDGSIIWAQDRGRVIEYDKDGKPLRFVGVLQNVTRLKNVEMQLREKQATLDLAVNVAGLGTWDWDIPGDTVSYNDEYLKMLGISREDVKGTIEEWEQMNHPDDFPVSTQKLTDYLEGRIPSYECEIRMKRVDGSYVWTRDVGEIVARDAEGNPTRLLGGHLNVDALKRSQEDLKIALQKLEDNKLYLENEIEQRTKELVEQDRTLWTVNQVSRKLLAFDPNTDFSEVVEDCLRLLGESLNKSRVYIWKDSEDENGEVYCTQIYEWVKGVVSIQGIEEFAGVPYKELPNFAEATESGRCLNSLIRDLSDAEKAILEPQGIKTILIAPVSINGKRWGFIGVDNCEDEELYTGFEENMLLMSGSLLANTIEKMNTDARMREMEQRTQIMLDATPLCCNLWTQDFRNMSCNEEAARLFELQSQDEYLKRFPELSPEYQPCGRLSSEKALECVAKAFEEGYLRMEWMHQKLDGTPIPSEVTLVRMKYKEGFIVAGYTRDLREEKKMLAELRAKEDDLRAARDEALLSSKAKSNFLANMSHEIRTPMNAISGLAEIILRESKGRKSADYAKGIKSACGNLLNIINDILDISKIESGKLEIVHSQYELSSLLNDVITISRMRLGDKLLMFITDIDSRLPARLIGDEIRIKQVLINMLSNAIKFTAKGHISLKVEGSVNGRDAELRFVVEDSGVGIKQEDIERLFAEFERVNTTKNRTIEGTGLGLAISKQLCEMMGGRIELESTYGKGSTFTAVIPQDCPEYERLAQVKEEKTVLLYEPRELYRCSIMRTIENLECKCVSCTNQSELYETLESMQYDYILTASLHLKKVVSLVEKKKLNVKVAVFAEYGEMIGDENIYKILFPVNCLQLSCMLNGMADDGSFSGRNSAGANFTAPSAKVLVVDDNPVNLSVAAGLMEPYMFSIDTAENGLQAVDMVKSHRYDVVFMDHMMPEMDGIDATAEIRRLDDEYYRSLPIIALTANALVGTREMFIKEGMNDFLAKPIEINKLNHLLAKWLPKSKMIRDTAKRDVKTISQKPDWEIDGVDIVSGIAAVGGNKENYLNIISVFYSDGCRKAPILLRYVTEKSIQAFKTEVHAIKSASATIGAFKLSSMAAKLEAAAQNEDIEYIDDNTDDFLTELQRLLDAMRPIISKSEKSSQSESDADENIAYGDLSVLSQLLDKLREAAEFANIAKIDDVLKEINAFSWQKQIADELSSISASLSLFDYDGVLECIERLKEKNG